eukprot:3191864-Rhodomonas_salina.1
MCLTVTFQLPFSKRPRRLMFRKGVPRVPLQQPVTQHQQGWCWAVTLSQHWAWHSAHGTR